MDGVHDRVHDRPWPIMHAAMNDAMDEATGTSMDEPMIEQELYVKNDTGIVLVVSPTERNVPGGTWNAVYFQFSNTLENRNLED